MRLFEFSELSANMNLISDLDLDTSTNRMILNKAKRCCDDELNEYVKTILCLINEQGFTKVDIANGYVQKSDIIIPLNSLCFAEKAFLLAGLATKLQIEVCFTHILTIMTQKTEELFLQLFARSPYVDLVNYDGVYSSARARILQTRIDEIQHEVQQGV